MPFVACRRLLELSGPLPQYHPTFLAALLLAGRPGAAVAVLQRLTAWLAALRLQQGEGVELGEAPGSVADPTALLAFPGKIFTRISPEFFLIRLPHRVYQLL